MQNPRTSQYNNKFYQQVEDRDSSAEISNEQSEELLPQDEFVGADESRAVSWNAEVTNSSTTPVDAIYAPANDQSFAPPQNLDRLPRIIRKSDFDRLPPVVKKSDLESPAQSDAVPKQSDDASKKVVDFSSSQIYKSPIDTYLHVEKKAPSNTASTQPAADNAHSLETDEMAGELSSNPSDAIEQTQPQSQLAEINQAPPRDMTTGGLQEFVSRDLPSLSFATDTTSDADSVAAQVPLSNPARIVLRSQSEKLIAQLKQEKLESAQPPAQLLLPNFESFQGAPELEQDPDLATQWEPAQPTDSTPGAETPTGTPQWTTYTPSPSNEWEPTDDLQNSALVQSAPVEPSARVTAIEENDIPLQQSHDPWYRDSDTLARPVIARQASSSSNITQQPSTSSSETQLTAPLAYRFENDAHALSNQQDSGVYDQTALVATTASPEPLPQPQLQSDLAWLSPWWVLAVLIPFAFYFALRVAKDDRFEYTLSSAPELPPEMTRRPGYSKSDPVYGDHDLLLAKPVPAAPRSIPGMRFAQSADVQTNEELDQSSSPNFRAKKKRA